MAKYPNFVIGKPETNNMKVTQFIRKREILRVRICGKNEKKIMVIMMNPSKADKNKSDNTINKVLKFVHSDTNSLFSKIPGVGEVIIVNLFPFYKTQSGQLQHIINSAQSILGQMAYEDLISENNKIIGYLAEQVDYVVLAWGNVPNNMHRDIHKAQIRNISNLLHDNHVTNKIFVLKTNKKPILTKEGFPRHPSRVKIQNLVFCRMNSLYEIELVINRKAIKLKST